MGSLLEIKQNVKEGSLSAALESAKQAVRADPGDASVRAALFVLFAANGEWGKSADQLKNCLNLGGNPGLVSYGALIDANAKRLAVLEGVAEPSFPGGDKPEWVDDWLLALKSLNAGDEDELKRVSEKRLEALNSLTGFNAEFEFEGFRNGDTRLMGFFEGVFEGEYAWLPFEDVLRIAVPERPELLQDFLWLPVMVHLRAGRPMQGYLYATTPHTDVKGNDSERLGRASGWDDRFDDLDIGLGLQWFALGSEMVPVFQLGQCCFNSVGTEDSAPVDSGEGS